jgi:flagellar secretion chaperone FliS
VTDAVANSTPCQELAPPSLDRTAKSFKSVAPLIDKISEGKRLNRQKEYLLTRVRSASPMELVSILYETAIQSTEDALANLRAGDILKRGEAVNKAVETIFELNRSLRHDVQPEYSRNLAGLYVYMQRRLSEAHAVKSAAMFEEVARLLRTLHEGWIGAMQNNQAELSAPPSETEVHAALAAGPYFAEPVSLPKEARSWSL